MPTIKHTQNAYGVDFDRKRNRYSTPETYDPDTGNRSAAQPDEGNALLVEDIAARANEIDLVMINGYGFPSHKDVPMFAAEQR
ncbi:hypothetical protein [Rhizobium rhizogenes]|uniref:Uncharacterized protein n=1 Tax=Rhizobium rhizogenes NBRC 13257 TaxID=1220581 RepID=A0AA87Q1S7_RHIRH|nr:hypothetical protein [Rhizobium rhizogenes]NTG67913.1 hypothetical protein [Rhizobium rhizogenes]NTI68732.1 hypothetical protein [Rhizobium rhizogenes]GAJ93961.1 hypothetical protein RRH01S_07_01610 [Rhizobium rhizogenes NBRC 13257]